MIINGHTVNFQQRIVKVLSFPSCVVIHLKTADFQYGDKLVGRNLVAYDSAGKFLWRVEDHGFTTLAGPEDMATKPDENGIRTVPQSIFEVEIIEETGMIDANIIDFSLTVDPRTGKIIDREYHR